MSTSSETIVIVGSGLAGVSAAGTLREHGFAGRLVLVGEEPELPYDRPPLSKSVLVHDEFAGLIAQRQPGDLALRAPEQIALRPAAWYQQQRIELMLGRRVVQLRPAAHALELEGGTALRFDRLLLATGARVRRLAGVDSGPALCLYLRTLGDAVRLRQQLRPGCRLVLLGGGVIGMEVAASAVLRGCDVTVIELASRIMERALTAPVSEHIAAYHRSKGVKLHLGVRAERQGPASAPGIVLTDGRTIPADLVVIGIGVMPNTDLAAEAGLSCQDGIVVDEFGATSAADVYAAGDAVRYPDSFFGRMERGENWMHAQNQAAAVARNMVGTPTPYQHVPHMWSDQYDLKIQVTGRHDTAEHVLRGQLAANKFMQLHMADGRLVGATGVNESRDMKFAQRLIEARVALSAAQLADPAFNLKKALGSSA
jgi:NADPH-dependent 2,4-dienoyl-CoA reductase/sulfur reductase-like enzyme